jgi:hypothetical protein
MEDRRVVEKIENCVESYTIACSFRNVVWAFRGVYGPNDDGEKRYLWDELVGLMSWWELSWCIGGILMWFGFQEKNQVTLERL